MWHMIVDAFHTSSLGAYEVRALTLGWLLIVLGVSFHTIVKGWNG